MTPVELILSKLPDARRNGRGWQARCPAHDDRRPSLNIAEGDDGRALVRCHAGCSAEAIVAQLGLKLSDLMPAGNGKAIRRPASKSNAAKVYPTAAKAVSQLESIYGPRAAMWTYCDKNGKAAGVVVRWDTTGGKDIRPVSRNGKGWIIGGMPEPRPLYHLPELLASTSSRVYVCEGEKAAEAVQSVDLLATTSPHGSKSAAMADWNPLAGRDVVILPDNDPAGESYADEVAGILSALDPPAHVRTLNLPKLPEGGDFVEYLEACCAAGLDNSAIRAEVDALADDVESAARPAAGPVLVCLADVDPREVQWLWHGRVPLGRITLLVGRPGEGKSFLTTDMAARVTTGKDWPDGNRCPDGSVILVCAEDDPGDTIRPRLDAQGADVRRVYMLPAVRRVNEKGEPCEVLFTLADVVALDAALKARPDCKLIVVDPIGSFLGGKTDAHRDNEVRAVLAPVARLAEKYGVAVLIVAHRRKSAGSIADDLAIGSRAFTGIARAVWHLTRDSEDKGRRLLLPGKNNLAREGTGLAFRIAGESPAVVWEPGSVSMSADDALAVENAAGRNEKPGPEPEARNAAATWLRELLGTCPVPVADLKAEAKAAGYAWRTVHRAADSIGVHRRKCSFSGGWIWELPAEDDRRRCQVSEQADNVASRHLRKNEPKNADSDPGSLEDAKLNLPGTLASESPAERQPDRPPPEGIPPKVWAKLQARKAAAPRIGA